MFTYWLVCPSILGRDFPDQSWVPRIFALYIPLSVYLGFLLPIYQGSGDFTRWNVARVFRSGAWTVAVAGLALVAWLTVLNLLIVQILILGVLCAYLYSRLGYLKGRNKGEGTESLRRILKNFLAI
jgi:ABC-type Fe3+ transport system permease subunit